MADLDELERLVALRQTDALTEAEFQIEKAKLGIGLPDRRAEATRSGPRRWPIVVITAVATVILMFVLLIASALFNPITVDRPANRVEEGAEPAEGNQGSIEPLRMRGRERSLTTDDERLMKQAGNAWADSREGDAGAEAAGERHAALLDRLQQRGICWGKSDEVQAEYAFHSCDPDSLQMIQP